MAAYGALAEANGDTADVDEDAQVDTAGWDVKITDNIKKGRSEDGFKMVNDYIVKQILGEGSFGKVVLVERVGEGARYVSFHFCDSV
jgi:hypothetical protein